MFYPSIHLPKTQIRIIFQLLLITILFFSIINSSVAGCVYKADLKVDELQIGNMITWVTVAENNTDKFIIQKSKEGITFEIVGEINGAGFAQKESSYRYLDTSLGEEKAFYRLVQIDKDGSENYTPTVLVNRNITNNYVITGMSSTVTDGIFSCSLRSNVEGNMILNTRIISDDTLVDKKEWPIVKGLNVVTIDMVNLDNETYGIDFILVGEKESLVVQKIDTDKVPNINYVVKE